MHTLQGTFKRWVPFVLLKHWPIHRSSLSVPVCVMDSGWLLSAKLIPPTGELCNQREMAPFLLKISVRTIARVRHMHPSPQRVSCTLAPVSLFVVEQQWEAPLAFPKCPCLPGIHGYHWLLSSLHRALSLIIIKWGYCDSETNSLQVTQLISNSA